jgi:hypothetical protein
MGTATLLCDLDGFNGVARLYQLAPPLEGNKYVIVSAAIVPFSGPETYIFAADLAGSIRDWHELTGSYRGGLDHARALKSAGYKIVEPPAKET